jgi:hypothetical protein
LHDGRIEPQRNDRCSQLDPPKALPDEPNKMVLTPRWLAERNPDRGRLNCLPSALVFQQEGCACHVKRNKSVNPECS